MGGVVKESEFPPGENERQCLTEAIYWDQQRKVATQRYAEALVACKQLGLSNTLIAKALGKTEPAIRRFLNRRIQT